MKSFRERFDPQQPGFTRRWVMVLAVLSLFSGIFFFLCMLYGTEGHLSAPLDDTFIYFQYARQNSQGEFFRYNSQDPPSTGATGFLYAWLLTLGYLTGFHDAYLLLFSYGLGLISLFFSCLALYLIGKELWGPPVGLGASLSLVFYGPILWIYFSGMEMGLFVTFMLFTAYFYIKETASQRPLVLTALFAAMMVLSRPEGLILSLILLLAAYNALNENRAKKAVWLLLPAAAGLALLGFNYLLTGSFSPNSLKSKSPLFLYPFDTLEVFYRSTNYYLYFLKDLLGGLPGYRSRDFNANEGETLAFLPPLALLFFLLGLFHQGEENKNRRVLGLLFAWFFVGTLAVAVMVPIRIHWNRYLLPYLPLFILMVFGGFDFLSRKLDPQAKGNPFPKIFGGFFIYFFIFTLVSFFYFGAAFGKNCKDIYFQQITLGRWINRHLPASASLAVNDAGALRYFGQRRTIDYFGLTTNEILQKKILGPGCLYEYLRNQERPPYSAMHTVFFDPAKWNLATQKIYTAGLMVHTIAGGDTTPLVLYQLSWEEALKGDLPAAPLKEKLKNLRLIDQINVAYNKAEIDHRYQSYSVEGVQDSTLVHRGSYIHDPKLFIIDGGRLISGGEVMTVKVPRPGPVVMVLRTDEPFYLEVEVNERTVGHWQQFTNPGGPWMEETFILPAEAIKAGENTIHLKNLARHRNFYFSYHYWFYQE